MQVLLLLVSCHHRDKIKYGDEIYHVSIEIFEFLLNDKHQPRSIEVLVEAALRIDYCGLRLIL